MNQTNDLTVSRRHVFKALAVGSGLMAAGDAASPAAAATTHRQFGLSVRGSTDTALSIALGAGTALGRLPNIVNTYQAWSWSHPFPATFVNGAAQRGITPQITWEPWDPTAGTLQLKYRLTALSAYDRFVDAFAHSAAQTGKPVNLRFAHEMNGWWYPWAIGQNLATTPADYIQAWRRLHGRFTAAGATRVKWTWSVNNVTSAQWGTSPTDIARCYPGDDVVDVISLDAYDRNGTLSPRALLEPSLTKLAAIAPTKPIWINEIGTARGSTRAAWISECFDYLKTTKVAALVWFNIAAPGQPDWRLTATAACTNAARTALRTW